MPGDVEAAGVFVLAVGPPPAQTASWSAALDDRFAVTTIDDTAVIPATRVLQTVDCVVARYDTGQTSGARVVDAVAAERPGLPVVLAAPARQATAALDAGATDVVRVDDGRINPVVASSRIAAVAEHADGGRRFRDAIERVGDAFFAVDTNYRVTYANDAGAEVLRGAMGADYDRRDLVGRHLWEEIPDAVGTQFYDAYTTAIETQEPVLFEAEYEPLDAWFDVRAHPDPGGLSVYFTDVSERKERERALNGVLDATRRFIRADSVPEVVAATMDAAEDALGEDVVSLRLADHEEGRLTLAALSEAAEGSVVDPPTYGVDEGPPGRALQSGESVVVDDLEAAVPADYGDVSAALFVPVGDHGVIGIGDTEPGALGDRDATHVELLAVTAAAALDRLDSESELRHLQRIVGHVDESVFLLDDAGRFSYVSDRLASVLGADREALRGAPLSSVVADSERCDRFLDGLRRGGPAEATTFEADLETPTGRQPVELEVSMTGSGDPDEWAAGAATDITDLAAVRSDLAAERGRFLQLFTNLPDPVAEVEYRDGEPVVQYVNPAFTEVFGYQHDEVAGESLNDFVVAEGETGDARAFDERAMRGDYPREEVERLTADGHRDFLLRCIPYSNDGDTRSFVVYTEITDQKERERYLQVLNRVLRHNLRNDLTVVLGLARELESSLDGREAEQAAMLTENAEAIASLSSKATEMERFVRRGDGETRPVDAASRLRSEVDALAADNPEVSVDVDLPDSLWVQGTDELDRAFAELVENAVEHSESGTDLSVSVSDGRGDGWTALRIRDDGPGIPDGEWQAVMGDAELTQLQHGTGMGMWLARSIVESFGGEVRRLSEDESGTTIELLFRAASPPDVAVADD